MCCKYNYIPWEFTFNIASTATHNRIVDKLRTRQSTLIDANFPIQISGKKHGGVTVPVVGNILGILHNFQCIKTTTIHCLFTSCGHPPVASCSALNVHVLPYALQELLQILET